MSAVQVKCPKCGRKQDHRGPGAIYYCPNCQMQHDDDPEEGGSHWNDPSKRIEKQEEFRGRRRR